MVTSEKRDNAVIGINLPFDIDIFNHTYSAGTKLWVRILATYLALFWSVLVYIFRNGCMVSSGFK